MYLSHFGLSALPFTLTPDPGFCYHLPHQQDAINMLMLGLRMGEGFMKITGEIGSGKTFISCYVSALLKEKYHVIYIANPHLNRIELLHEMADALDIPDHHVMEGRPLLNRIQEKVVATHLAGKKVVIMVDEAQAVPVMTLEALRMLTNFETKKRKLIQVILFGQPELNQLLSIKSMRPLRQRILFSYHLKPLTQKETYAYIRHRIYVARKKRGEVFDEKALRKIYLASRGFPRLINIIAHKSLLSAFGLRANQVGVYHVRRAISDTDGLQARWFPFSLPLLSQFRSKKFSEAALREAREAL